MFSYCKSPFSPLQTFFYKFLDTFIEYILGQLSVGEVYMFIIFIFLDMMSINIFIFIIFIPMIRNISIVLCVHFNLANCKCKIKTGKKDNIFLFHESDKILENQKRSKADLNQQQLVNPPSFKSSESNHNSETPLVVPFRSACETEIQ